MSAFHGDGVPSVITAAIEIFCDGRAGAPSRRRCPCRGAIPPADSSRPLTRDLGLGTEKGPYCLLFLSKYVLMVTETQRFG